MKILTILSVAFMVSACGHQTPWRPPANLTLKCPSIDKLEAGDGKTLLPWAERVITNYNICSARHAGLVKSLPPNAVPR